MKEGPIWGQKHSSSSVHTLYIGLCKNQNPYSDLQGRYNQFLSLLYLFSPPTPFTYSIPPGTALHQAFAPEAPAAPDDHR